MSKAEVNFDQAVEKVLRYDERMEAEPVRLADRVERRAQSAQERGTRLTRIRRGAKLALAVAGVTTAVAAGPEIAHVLTEPLRATDQMNHEVVEQDVRDAQQFARFNGVTAGSVAEAAAPTVASVQGNETHP